MGTVAWDIGPLGSLHHSAPVGVAEGVLDVTGYPFQADNSGRVDATAALQAALDFARHNYMMVYLPVGVYTVGCSCALRLRMQMTMLIIR